MSRNNAQPSPKRRQLYRLLAIGNAQLTKTVAGWDDDVYRDILRQCGAAESNGRYSATTMRIDQLETALERLKRSGFKPKPARHRMAKSKQGLIRKLTAIWIQLAEAGVVRDRSEAAMLKFAYRHTNSARLEWATTADLSTAVEALKSWASREGVALQNRKRAHSA